MFWGRPYPGWPPPPRQPQAFYPPALQDAGAALPKTCCGKDKNFRVTRKCAEFLRIADQAVYSLAHTIQARTAGGDGARRPAAGTACELRRSTSVNAGTAEESGAGSS